MTGAAGSRMGEVAGCHRVRRRCARYAFFEKSSLNIYFFFFDLLLFGAGANGSLSNKLLILKDSPIGINEL